MAIGELKTVVLDAPDIARLSAFYTALAGWTQTYADDEWITMTTDDGWRIGLQRAPDHVPPQWPDPAYPQQAHLDLRVPDLDGGDREGGRAGRHAAARERALEHPRRPGRPPVRPVPEPRTRATTLMGVMLDCPDAKALSTFYSELLGKPITYEGEGVGMIGEDGDRP